MAKRKTPPAQTLEVKSEDLHEELVLNSPAVQRRERVLNREQIDRQVHAFLSRLDEVEMWALRLMED